MNTCTICCATTNSKCSNCNQVFYCSVQHQKQDWKKHKSSCHPYKIVFNDELGRHLITTRKIKESEILINEAPLMRGPSQITGPVCLGCLNKIDINNYINCEKCGWPLCSADCIDIGEHAAECELTQKRGRKVNIENFTIPHPLYQCLSIVRCLMLDKSNKQLNEQFYELESLETERRGSIQWKADLESIGKFIPKFFNTNDFEEDYIMKAVGILQINGHEVPSTEPAHVAIFYNASFLEHSCSPNLAKSFTNNGHIILWAPKAIKKNSHLSICYSDAMWGTADRQNHLMYTKLFKCSCTRCLDITELGTNYSALKCQKKVCDGILLPQNFNEWNANWRCYTCQVDYDKLYIANTLEKARSALHGMEKNEENCLRYIQYYKKLFDAQHFLISDIKIHLIHLIGKDPTELMTITNESLNLKINCAKEILKLLEILTPCEIRILGTLCFELHSALAEKTRRLSQKRNVSLKDLLYESLFYVEKSIIYLQNEPELFIEGHILKQAKINRDGLKIILKM